MRRLESIALRAAVLVLVAFVVATLTLAACSLAFEGRIGETEPTKVNCP